MSKAIVTYDPYTVRQWNCQAEGLSIAHLVKRGLLGEPYPEERGIMSIELEPDVAITLPLDWVETLVAMAKERGATDYKEREILGGVAHEVDQVKTIAQAGRKQA